MRLTADIDLVVDLEPEETRRTIRALCELGLKPRIPVNAEDFADPEIREAWIEDKGMEVFSMFDPSNPLLCVDLFVSYPIPFEEIRRIHQSEQTPRGDS